MKRTDRYPDTRTFHYYNANPKNRITGDCVIRAIATATETPYNDIVIAMAQLQCETGYDAIDLIGKYFEKIGWTKHRQPRKPDNAKYTGKEFCRVLQEWLCDKWNYGMEYKDGIMISPRIFCNIGGHHVVAIIDGKVNDIWDSTDGCVGNYWTKE